MSVGIRVGVVVALNHHEHPEEIVRRLAAQTADPASFEAVLVDGDPRRDASEAVAAAKRETGIRSSLRYLRALGRGRAGMLNVGVSETRGDAVLFFAGDGLPPPH